MFSTIFSVTCACQLKEESTGIRFPDFRKTLRKRKTVWREEVTVYKKVDKNIGYTCSQDSDPSARLDIEHITDLFRAFSQPYRVSFPVRRKRGVGRMGVAPCLPS